MTLDIVVGVTGVGLAWGLAAAQWLRARRSPAGISVLSWAVFCALNLTWVVYALGVGNPYLVANGAGAAALNVALLTRIDPHRGRTLGLVGATAALGAATGVVLGWPVVAVWAFALAVFLRWPQVAELLRAPDVEGVSLTSWVLAAVNNAVWVVVGILEGDAWFSAVSILLGVSSLTVVALILRRRRPGDPRGAGPSDPHRADPGDPRRADPGDSHRLLRSTSPPTQPGDRW